MRITTNEKYSCWALLGIRTFWTCSKLSYQPAEATRTRRTLFALIVIVIVIARMTKNDQEWSLEQTRIVSSSSFESRFGTVKWGISGVMTVQTEAYYGKSERNTVKWRRCEVAVRWRKVALRLYCPITTSSLQHDGGKKKEWNDHVRRVAEVVRKLYNKVWRTKHHLLSESSGVVGVEAIGRCCIIMFIMFIMVIMVIIRWYGW